MQEAREKILSMLSAVGRIDKMREAGFSKSENDMPVKNDDDSNQKKKKKM